MAVQSEHDKNTPDLERVALHLALQYLPDSGTEGTGGSGGDSDGDSAGDTCVSPARAAKETAKCCTHTSLLQQSLINPSPGAPRCVPWCCAALHVGVPQAQLQR